MTRRLKLKQLWPGSKKKKTSVDISKETVRLQENKGDTMPNTPPPPYTRQSSQDRNEDLLPDRNNPYPALARCASKKRSLRCATFHWLLVDVVAATFSTDIWSLKTALANVDPVWAPNLAIDSASIWEKRGKMLVAETGALVRNLEREMARGRWLLIHPRDKYLVKRMVLDPVRKYHMNLDFVLEVLGRFERSLD